MENHNLIVRLATADDKHYSETITTEMEESAKARGTGIAKRSPAYIEMKMEEGKAVIAVTEDGTWVGFCYIEAWEHGKYVANSGLIVAPPFRKTGVATEIKQKIFALSREKYPTSKIFGLTTGLAVMKINSDLGYEPVTYSELTSDEEFWKGCKSCVNYEILMSKGRKNCMCTAMLFDPAEAEAKLKAAEAKAAKVQAQEVKKPETTTVSPEGELVHHRHREFKGNLKLFDRWVRFKQFVLLKSFRRKDEGNGDSPDKKRSLLSIFFW
ncbi:GNAT family N-acetyltransferase [Chryseolinea lacunae]|uniref:GNAT family N-acetyltransferase n=1 Tax=Chryseolinea lacunae TaxID=2801331 RepID=A0ABS1KWV3_9BACT|nr:GNAT family N-acetyltransferase [Chryseolinea lacunae]MBL0742791.1 GNAT family N-acetyltransferase [Chryseolinea lacunae]